MQNEREPVEVTIIGGGLAGMAASIHLADAGLRVLCIETDPVAASVSLVLQPLAVHSRNRSYLIKRRQLLCVINARFPLHR